MELVLKVVKYQNQPLSEPLSFTFDQQGGTIGRAMDNHWVLPDPHKYISAHHAIISYENGDYFITDTSSNGVFIYPSTVPLGRGNKVKLEEGQVLSIGEYEIEVHLQVMDRHNTLYSFEQQKDVRADSANNPFVSPHPDLNFANIAESAPLDNNDPLTGNNLPEAEADSLNRDINAFADSVTPLAKEADPFASDHKAIPENLFDELPSGSSHEIAKDDPFAENSSQVPLADFFDGFGAASPNKADDVFTDMDGVPVEGNMVDDQFKPTVADDLFPETPLAEDPFADLSPDGLVQQQEQPFEAAQPDHASPLHEAFEPPSAAPSEPFVEEEAIPLADNWWEEDTADVREDVQMQITQSQPSVPNEPLNEITLDTAARLNAISEKNQLSETDPAIIKFCQGARLDQTYAAQLDADTFYQIGLMFRTAVAGALEVLQSRAEIKNEMKLDMTMIRPQQNNPLKFAPTVDEALIRLLNAQPGYMDGVKAMQEAFDDIKVHQLAVISGMQFAIQSLLKKFDPKQLQKRLEQKHPIEAKIPIHRQARLWSLFEELYEEIEQEAQEDFNHLFDRAFAQAYEEQIKRFK